jgi:hypothetical protein
VLWASAFSQGADRCHFRMCDSNCASGVLLSCSVIATLSTIVPLRAEFFNTDKRPKMVLHKNRQGCQYCPTCSCSPAGSYNSLLWSKSSQKEQKELPAPELLIA